MAPQIAHNQYNDASFQLTFLALWLDQCEAVLSMLLLDLIMIKTACISHQVCDMAGFVSFMLTKGTTLWNNIGITLTLN